MTLLKRNKEKSDIYLLLLKLSHLLFLTYSLLGHIPLFKTPLKYSTFIAIGLFILNFFMQYNRAPIKEVGVYATLMIVSLIQSYFSGNYGLFKLVLFAGSIRKVDFKDIVRFDMYLRAVLIALCALLCAVGIAPDVTMMYDGILRHSLGFTNPNALGIATFVLACDIFYVFKMKMNWKRVLILAGLSYWLYDIARCRTAVYAIVALLIAAIIYTFYPRIYKNKFTEFIISTAPMFLSLLTLIAVKAYNNGASWAILVNDLLTNRIKAVSNFARYLSPKLWGQPIGETIDHSLDNTYGFVWLDLGILVFCLFVFAYYRMIKKNYKYDNLPLCIIFLVFMVYGLSEHLWIFIDYNIFMIALFYNPEKFIKQEDQEHLSHREYYQRYDFSKLKTNSDFGD